MGLCVFRFTRACCGGTGVARTTGTIPSTDAPVAHPSLSVSAPLPRPKNILHAGSSKPAECLATNRTSQARQPIRRFHFRMRQSTLTARARRRGAGIVRVSGRIGRRTIDGGARIAGGIRAWADGRADPFTAVPHLHARAADRFDHAARASACDNHHFGGHSASSPSNSRPCPGLGARSLSWLNAGVWYSPLDSTGGGARVRRRAHQPPPSYGWVRFCHRSY